MMLAERTSQPPWKPVLVTIAGVFLGAVFLLAGIAKLFEPGAFVEQIHLEGLDFLLPAGTVAVIALALEAGLGTALVLGIRHLIVLVPTTGLVIFFLSLTGRNYWLVSTGRRDPDVSCGCFGSLLERTPSEAFWQDLFLLLPPLIILLWGWYGSRRGIPSRRLWASVGVAFVVGVITYVSPQLRFSQVAADIASLEADSGFLPSKNFSVIIDGEQSDESAVYQSEGSAEMIVLSPRLSGPLVIDPRLREFRLLESGLNGPDADGKVHFGSRIEVASSGSFSVEAGGIILNLHGVEIRIESRLPDPSPRVTSSEP